MQQKIQITWDEFARVDMRVGRITDASSFPEAKKPAYRLAIDFGAELGVRHSSAQITQRYSTHELVGRTVVAVVNMPPKKIAGFTSEVLVLGVADSRGEIVLLSLEEPIEPGSPIY